MSTNSQYGLCHQNSCCPAIIFNISCAHGSKPCYQLEKRSSSHRKLKSKDKTKSSKGCQPSITSVHSQNSSSKREKADLTSSSHSRNSQISHHDDYYDREDSPAPMGVNTLIAVALEDETIYKSPPASQALQQQQQQQQQQYDQQQLLLQLQPQQRELILRQQQLQQRVEEQIQRYQPLHQLQQQRLQRQLQRQQQQQPLELIILRQQQLQQRLQQQIQRHLPQKQSIESVALPPEASSPEKEMNNIEIDIEQDQPVHNSPSEQDQILINSLREFQKSRRKEVEQILRRKSL